MCPKSSRAGSLIPQSLSAVPIGLAFSKPGIVWQPKQPSREMVLSPRYKQLFIELQLACRPARRLR